MASALSNARNASERAQRALLLLCEVRGARSGYLFVAANDGLQLAAASTPEPADDMLQRLIDDFWSQQLDDGELETALLSDDANATQIWTDRRGLVFRPLLLRGQKHGEARVAGVALLQEDAGKSATTDEIRVLTEIANGLLRTG